MPDLRSGERAQDAVMDTFNLTPVQRTAAALLLAASVLLGAGSWSAARQQGAPERNADFQQAAAGIYGRIQLMRNLERQLLASAANPERAALYLDKRQQARQRIDELVREARATAVNENAREYLEQLVMLAQAADARFEKVSAHLATKGNAHLAGWQAL
jgi:CHASE3 domain sensor protein